MTQVTRFWPLLLGSHRYDKAISTRGRGAGELITAPILAYLVETRSGRILFDVGCDYRKIHDPALRRRYYDTNPEFPFGPPEISEADRLDRRLAQLGLTPSDIDVVFLSHLHFDHAGGLGEVAGAEVHVHADELAAAAEPADPVYFADEVIAGRNWRAMHEEYELVPGVRAITSPGHTAGHMSLRVELPKGRPILLAGDAADLRENLDEEVAPGVCWHDRTDLAVASIRKLKALAAEDGGEVWPNHDQAFFEGLKPFPTAYE